MLCREIDGHICKYHDQVEPLRQYGQANKETLAELLHSFFDYWTHRHDWAQGVVSIRTLTPITKAAKGWRNRRFDEHEVSVEVGGPPFFVQSE